MRLRPYQIATLERARQAYREGARLLTFSR